MTIRAASSPHSCKHRGEPSVIEPRDTPSGDAASTERRAFAWRALLAWYASDGRAALPWRHTRDPYAVLVSEVMLQQTQVERVLPKYRAFLEQFPTLDRKSTRLNSSHPSISYAVFCLKKK